MAKSGGNEDRAKVKLRVVEFELEGGNAAVENSIRQITHALAIRNGPPARMMPPKPPNELAAGVPAETDEAEEIIQDVEYADAGDTGQEQPTKPAKPKTTYKPRVPTYLHDLDMTGTGVTFKDFAAQKNPTKATQRHLVAAYWLKEHGNSPTTTMDKVYTCYRTAEWPTNQSDWDVNFRSQVKTNRFRRVSPGEYAITPIGENDVRTLDGTE
ncbi:MAG TPA: hypothetical protein VE959_05190 [Bryobacteraceae bacterium]|nr:hypothetical protein [Bryobacteraceae bacterium]